MSNVPAPARKYNPGFLTDEELVASFCVRTAEFELLLDVLRTCTGSSNPHQIVIGPRGSGKTSLLLRVVAEVRRDTALAARCFPVVFAEESYEVATAGEFWLECLTHLAAQAPRSEDDPDLQRTADELRTIRDDRALADRCLAALLDFADRHDKRLLLVVENLNALFRDMTDADAGWRLRKVLQTEPRIIVFASATSRFDEIDHPERALCDLFQIRKLRALDTEQCTLLWEKAADRAPVTATVRALEILTGGSPRLIAIVARFGAGLSFRRLMADLLGLVDDHTEYFKSHIESLPAQERRVYLALATLWKPATTREIAEQARLDTSTCSAQLARLGERGVVQVAGGSVRRKQYYLSERLYNIYYLLRRRRGPDRVVEALIRFMEAFYSPSELKEIGVRIALEVGDLDAEMQQLHSAAFTQLVELPALVAHRDELLTVMPAVVAVRAGSRAATADGAPPTAARTVDSLARAARELFENTAALSNSKRPEDGLAACKEVVRRFGERQSPGVLQWVAKALVNQGLAHRQLNQPQAALAAWDEVLERFGDRAVPVFMEAVARALVMKGGLLAEADRPRDALEALEEVVRRFERRRMPILRDFVAMALGNKGLVLLRLKRVKDALEVWDEMKRRFSASKRPVVVEQVAKALVNEGTAFQELNRPDDALAAWEEVERRFGVSAPENLYEPLATALVNRGVLLGGMDRSEDALAVYNDVVRRFGGSDATAVLAQVARALFGKAAVLDGLNRPEEVLGVCDDVLHRFGTSREPAFFYLVATILVNKGATLCALRRPDAALDAWDEVVHRFGSSETAVLLEQVAKALVKKGVVLDSLNRREEAMVAYDETVRRYAASDIPDLQEQVAQALVNKGALLYRLGRFENALAVSDEVERRFGTSETPTLRVQVAKGLVNKGAVFGGLNLLEEAVVACDDVVRRFGTSWEPALVELVALVLGNKALTLDRMGRAEDALATRHEAVRRLEESEAPELRSLTETALLEKADMEVRCRQFESAIKTAGQLLERCAADSLKNRLRGHLIRSKAALARADWSVYERDVESVLDVLPELESVPKEAIDALMRFSIERGPKRMRELIQSSPSAEILMPLLTVFEEDLGLEPRVAQEVRAVAKDIRAELAKLKQVGEASRDTPGVVGSAKGGM